VGPDGRAVAEHHQIDQGLAVDGIGHRLANQLIVKRFGLVVGGHDHLTRGSAGIDLETRVLA
jgi:hypothetical protein